MNIDLCDVCGEESALGVVNQAAGANTLIAAANRRREMDLIYLEMTPRWTMGRAGKLRPALCRAHWLDILEKVVDALSQADPKETP